jgi:hypothetical protein
MPAAAMMPAAALISAGHRWTTGYGNVVITQLT